MAYTPRGFPTPVISPAGAGTVAVEKTYEESDSDYWYNEWKITATAKPGYRFVRFEWAEWQDYPSPGREITGTASSPWYPYQGGTDWGGSIGYEEYYTTRVTAVFEVDPYYLKTVTTRSDPIAGGNTSGDGSYAPGSTVTIRATANAGYRFLKWVCLDTSLGESSDPVHDFTMPSYNVTWIAQFALKTGLILRSASSGVILRHATSGIILRDS